MTATAFACPFVAGVDEVGRGPLAGPVVAAAVILPCRGLPQALADSKKLTTPQRESLDTQIRACALAFALGEATVAEIDTFNILQASLLAMRRAVVALPIRPTVAWVDGNRPPALTVPVRAVVGGDGKVAAISAASIVAKVARDAQMGVLDEQYPGYGFSRHKGYGTAQHHRALQQLGVTAIHRRSFAPVARLVAPVQANLDYRIS